MEAQLVHHELAQQARWRPDRTAVAFEGETTTYAAFEARVYRVGRAMQAAGVGPGDRVLVHASNHADLYTLFFACSTVGAVFAPVSRFYGTADIAYVCEQIDPALVAHTDAGVVDETLPTVRAAVGDVPQLSLDDGGDDETLATFIEGHPPDPPEPEGALRPDRPHNVFFTSGTTGRPTGVVRDHHATRHFADPLLARFPFAEADRRLTTNDMMFAAPYLQYGLPTVMTGGTNVVLREYDPERVADVVDSWDINTMLLVFTQASTLLDYLDEHDRSLTIEHVHAVLPSADVARSLSSIAGDLYHIYATTEAGLPLVTAVTEPFAEMPTLGRPGVGADVAIADPEAEVAEPSPPEPGDEGELVCRGPVTMTRYLEDGPAGEGWDGDPTDNPPGRGGWVRTGDLVRVDDSGEVGFVGRVDNRIRSGGINIYPETVERVLSDHPDVRESVVVGVPDETWGERACALVVAPSADTERLDEFCRDRADLPDEKRPKEYAIVDELDAVPTSAVGKVDRQAIVSQFFE